VDDGIVFYVHRTVDLNEILRFAEYSTIDS
jgi:hypothetical protein